MNLDQVEKKLREARFFLSKMSEQERLAFSDKEPFDFYLSAFLNAAKTVDNRLRHEQKAIYPDWRKGWNKKITPAENSLIKFLIGDRNVEVHESGSGRTVKTEDIGVGDTYSDRSGTLQVGRSFPLGTPPVDIHKPTFKFTIGGTERNATEACEEYLTLLCRMVAKFKADHP